MVKDFSKHFDKMQKKKMKSLGMAGTKKISVLTNKIYNNLCKECKPKYPNKMICDNCLDKNYKTMKQIKELGEKKGA